MVLATSLTNASIKNKSNSLDETFFEKLRSCDDYNVEILTKYLPEHNTHDLYNTYTRRIEKMNNVCKVTFQRSLYTETYHPMSLIYTYKFPIKELTKINSSNFDKYAEKYYSEQNTLYSKNITKQESDNINKDFYDCLLVCKNYYLQKKDSSGNDYVKNIEKVGNKCKLDVHYMKHNIEVATDNEPLLENKHEIYEFSMNILKNITPANFDKYANKYSNLKK